MPESDLTVPRPLSDALALELQRLREAAPADKSQVSVSASTSGVSTGIVWRPTSKVTVTGYAGRLWGSGGWTGAAQGTLTW